MSKNIADWSNKDATAASACVQLHLQNMEELDDTILKEQRSGVNLN